MRMRARMHALTLTCEFAHPFALPFYCRATDLEYGQNVLRVKFGEGIAGTVAQRGECASTGGAT